MYDQLPQTLQQLQYMKCSCWFAGSHDGALLVWTVTPSKLAEAEARTIEKLGDKQIMITHAVFCPTSPNLLLAINSDQAGRVRYHH